MIGTEELTTQKVPRPAAVQGDDRTTGHVYHDNLGRAWGTIVLQWHLGELRNALPWKFNGNGQREQVPIGEFRWLYRGHEIATEPKERRSTTARTRARLISLWTPTTT